MEKYHTFYHRNRVVAIPVMIIVGLFIAMAAALLFGLVLMLLWNWLMPVIFGLPIITYWQAWGLVLLAHILFKSFPHHRPYHPLHRFRHDDDWKKKMRQRYRDYMRWVAEQELKQDETTDKE